MRFPETPDALQGFFVRARHAPERIMDLRITIIQRDGAQGQARFLQFGDAPSVQEKAVGVETGDHSDIVREPHELDGVPPQERFSPGENDFERPQALGLLDDGLDFLRLHLLPARFFMAVRGTVDAPALAPVGRRDIDEGGNGPPEHSVIAESQEPSPGKERVVGPIITKGSISEAHLRSRRQELTSEHDQSGFLLTDIDPVFFLTGQQSLLGY